MEKEESRQHVYYDVEKEWSKMAGRKMKSLEIMLESF